MKSRHLFAAAIMLSLLTVTGCSSGKPLPGDTLIAPVPAAASQNGYSSLSNISQNGFSSLSNMNSPNSANILAGVSSDRAYTLLDFKTAPRSVFADSRYLYVLEGEGKRIKVFDIENESLVREISDISMKDCTAFTVRDSNIYAFDGDSGRVLLFSSGGSLISSFDTGLSGTVAEKIIAARDRLIIMKIRSRQEEGSELAVLDTSSGAVEKVDGASLVPSSDGGSSSIYDICSYGDNSVLVGTSSGKLILYDAAQKGVKKICSFPLTAGFVEFDGNVLYYSSDGAIALGPGNTAKFSNVGRGRFVGRMLINGDFPWSDTKESLDSWFLDNLNIPYAADGRHYCMAQNSKYLFFLDLIPAVQGTGSVSKSDMGFILYRISK